jgi:RNA polymerase sigma-70 factor (ECF subfamily)
MLVKNSSRFEHGCRSDLRGRDDTWLVTAAQNGDIEAFEVLARRYRQVVLSIGWRSTGNPEDAEDILQQTLLKAFAHLRTFRGASSFSTWLVRIALNEGLMLRRKSWRMHKISLDEQLDGEGASFLDAEDQRLNPEDSYGLHERRSILRALLNSLTPAVRAVIEKYDLDDRSIKETAALLGISVSAVKARASRGRAILREKTRHYCDSAKSAVNRADRSHTSPRRVPRECSGPIAPMGECGG